MRDGGGGKTPRARPTRSTIPGKARCRSANPGGIIGAEAANSWYAPLCQ
ncbi:MAG: hypothetical protein U9Q07_08605 [Planctomycetota bacterium]|nr:hypothetical protein [Planctomycetota bacterium]